MRKLLLALALCLGMPQPQPRTTPPPRARSLTFGAKSVTSVLYPYFIGCDATTITQCWAIDASGRLTVNINGTVTITGTVAATQSGTWNVTNAGTFTTQVNGFTSWAGGTLGAMANYGTSPGAVLVPGVNAFVTNSNANGQATAANSSPVVLPAAQVTADPCTLGTKTNLPISYQTTSITQQIALSGSTKIYVCSLSLIASAATVFSVTGGTGTNCGTPAALIGTTSASNGLSRAANGGLTLGNGAGTVAVTGAGSELCLVQSGAGNISGNLTYVQQ